MTGRTWWLVAAVAGMHFLAQAAAMVTAIGRGLARFDHGGDPGAAARVLDFGASLLQFPLVLLARSLPLGGTGHWGWLILVANSLLWGVAVERVIALTSRR